MFGKSGPHHRNLQIVSMQNPCVWRLSFSLCHDITEPDGFLATSIGNIQLECQLPQYCLIDPIFSSSHRRAVLNQDPNVWIGAAQTDIKTEKKQKRSWLLDLPAVRTTATYLSSIDAENRPAGNQG